MSKVFLPSTIGRLCTKDYQFPKHIQALQREVLGTILSPINQNKNRLIVELPIRHGKSYYCSWHLAAWYLMTFPTKNVIFMTHSADFSEEWSAQVNKTIKEFGPGLTGVNIDKSFDTRSHFKTTHGGSYRAVGVGGSTTGKGADLLLCDDLVKDFEKAANPASRDKLSTFFRSEGTSRLSPTGKAIMVMSRRHPDDISGRLLKMNDDEKMPEEQKWRTIKFPALGEDDEPLWPEMWSKEKLLAIKEEHRIEGKSYLFDCLYQQNPRSDSLGMEFPREYLQNLWIDRLPAMYPRYRVLSIDPSLGKHANYGDYCAMVDSSMMPDNRCYVKTVAKRLNAKEIPEMVMALVNNSIQEGFPFSAIIIEANMAQEYCAENVSGYLERANIRIPLIRNMTESNASKETRIRNELTYELADGRIKLISPRHCPDNQMLYNQLEEFPLSKFDDCIDALSQSYLMFKKLMYGNKVPPPQLRLKV